MYAQSNQIITHPPKNNRINTNVLSIFISRCAVLPCLVTQSCPPVCDPMDCSLPGPSVHGGPPGKNTGVGCHALHLPNLGIELGSPALQADSFPAELPEKPVLVP